MQNKEKATKEKQKKKNWYILAGALFMGILAFLFCYNDILYSVDSLYRDKVYQKSRGVNQSIKIISIDQKTLNNYGLFGTWDRSIYADVLDALGDYPAVVGFDVLLTTDMSEEGDEVFLNKVKGSNTVLASYIDFDTVLRIDENENRKIDTFYVRNVEIPYTGDNCDYGYVNVAADSDGVVRRVLPYIYNSAADETYTSFSYKIYENYCKANNIVPVEPAVDSSGTQWIYFAGKPFDYETISLYDLLEGNIDPRVFSNCIVLVGAYENGLQDQFAVPNSSNQMFGVEINANIIQSYLDGAFPLPLNRLFISLILAMLVIPLFIVFSHMRLSVGSGVFVAIEAITVFVSSKLFTDANIIIPGSYFLIFFLIVYFIALIGNYLNQWITKKRMTDAFRKYVAPQVVDGLMKSGQYQITLGGENRDIAVLFVDIRGFTPLSESLRPDQVVEILNEYLNLTTSSIFKNSGTLDKFIGDATMAVFNAPFDLDDYEMRALRTAKDIVAGARALEESCEKRFGKKVTFGVGVNCGEAVVGNIGCETRMDYTAIGDTVNTAARLEANAKAGQVLISQTIYDRVKDRDVTVNPIGEIPLKGKSKGLFVYELTSIDGEKIM